MISILTDFVNLDPSYSLVRVALNQIKMLAANGHDVTLFVRSGFSNRDEQTILDLGARLKIIDPGEAGSNQIHVTEDSEQDIVRLAEVLDQELGDVVLTHDLLFQANMWKYNVACHRLKKPRRWLHWTHSGGATPQSKAGKYRKAIRSKIPGSRLVAFTTEEFMRLGGQYGYELDEIVLIPNPMDIIEYMSPLAQRIYKMCKLWRKDVVCIYPARLDRGKQPEVILEIFACLAEQYDVQVIFVDFASVAGDKAVYRKQLREQAEQMDVPVLFTSDLEGEQDGAPFQYCVPHKTILDLFELSDVFVHPSMSERDPLILQEAAWKRMPLILNFDLPVFRQYEGQALFGKFSSYIDVATGGHGETKTEYGDRTGYMRHIAGAIAYQIENVPVVQLHLKIRRERSLEGAYRRLWAAISQT